jgi:predicted kinase
VELIFPSDSVIVVAGVPGAGKTTLLRRAVDRVTARVVDTDDRSRRGPLLYPGHYARIAAAIAGGRPAVIHSRGTLPIARRTIALLARLRGRPAHLVLLHADRAVAEAGQAARGRTVARDEMDRQVARWEALLAAGGPTGEGWESVTLLDRAQAADVSALRFVTAPALMPVPA